MNCVKKSHIHKCYQDDKTVDVLNLLRLNIHEMRGMLVIYYPNATPTLMPVCQVERQFKPFSMMVWYDLAGMRTRALLHARQTR